MSMWRHVGLTLSFTDISRIHEAIDKIRQPLDAKAQEEIIIRAGYVILGV